MSNVNDRAGIASRRRLAKSASVLVALLFVLLRPVCDASAAQGPHPHAQGVQYVYSGASSADHHPDGRVCCASVDAQALAVPATPLFALGGAHAFSAPSLELRNRPVSMLPVKPLSCGDPAPPIPYHARSLRRLD